MSPDVPHSTSPCCPLTSEALGTEEAARYAEAFKALADPVRLRIISLIAADGCAPATVGALTDALGLSQPTVSHHLKKLTEAGFLARHQDGRSAVHTVRPETFAQLKAVLAVG
ncbi:ArsR/SmtB family transcription factor [Corynebacterium sp. LK2510]|uniref:ArsR/SmtB family transcription factor n=1 Tax=Corynebacterium sp. LK2510 TaxID=3110472 RepID=UPI0034CF6621